MGRFELRTLITFICKELALFVAKYIRPWQKNLLVEPAHSLGYRSVEETLEESSKTQPLKSVSQRWQILHVISRRKEIPRTCSHEKNNQKCKTTPSTGRLGYSIWRSWFNNPSFKAFYIHEICKLDNVWRALPTSLILTDVNHGSDFCQLNYKVRLLKHESYLGYNTILSSSNSERPPHIEKPKPKTLPKKKDED